MDVEVGLKGGLFERWRERVVEHGAAGPEVEQILAFEELLHRAQRGVDTGGINGSGERNGVWMV